VGAGGKNVAVPDLGEFVRRMHWKSVVLGTVGYCYGMTGGCITLGSAGPTLEEDMQLVEDLKGGEGAME